MFSVPYWDDDKKKRFVLILLLWYLGFICLLLEKQIQRSIF